jgi:hypothetical protein
LELQRRRTTWSAHRASSSSIVSGTSAIAHDQDHDALSPDDRDDVNTPTVRATTVWDVAGLLVLTFIMLAVTGLIPRLADGWLYRSRVVDGMITLAGFAAFAAVALGAVRERPKLGSIPFRLTNVWRDPPGDWVAFILGFALAAPLVGLYSRIPFSDTDSMRLVAAIRHVQRGNVDFLVETQDSFGPHLLLGPVLALGGMEGLRLVTILSVQTLAGVVAWLSRRLAGSMAAGAIAVVALLSMPIVVGRVLHLPMYPTMLALGLAGSWLAYRAIAHCAGWRYAAGAALCLVVAQEAQPVGQLFLAAPLLLLVTAAGSRSGAANVVRVYAGITLFMLPRLVTNVSEGGLSHLRSSRTDYWITEGYLDQIQREFHEYAGLGESHVTYLLQFPGRFATSLGDFGWVALLVAVIALLGLRGRGRWVALGFVGLIALAMTVRTIQPNPRYFSPLWPGIALLAGVLGAELLRRRNFAWRLLGSSIVVLLVCLSLLALRETGQRGLWMARQVDNRRAVAAAIDDGKGVIGVRAHELIAVDTDIPTFGGQFLTEDEYVTYLTWPDDEAVIEVMARHDIGWVLVRTYRALEVEYNNPWLVPHHGQEARHVEMVAASPNFCRVLGGPTSTLYRLGPCPSGA